MAPLKPLIVGVSPGPSKLKTIDQSPIMGWTGKRLAKLLHMSLQIYALEFERVNLFGESGREKTATSAEFLCAASWIRSMYDLKERVGAVFLGKRVANAFGWFPVNDTEFMQCEQTGRLCVCIPHPSGLNRYYNDPNNREHVIKVLSFFKSKALL
jgi:hypothetical protein